MEVRKERSHEKKEIPRSYVSDSAYAYRLWW